MFYCEAQDKPQVTRLSEVIFERSAKRPERRR